MRIAISGTFDVGRPEFISDLMFRWPSYKTTNTVGWDTDVYMPGDPDSGSAEIQERTMNAVLDEIMKHTRGDSSVAYPYSTIDVLVRSMWMAHNEIGGIDDQFIQKQIQLMKNSMTFYDIIFTIPLSKRFDIVMKDDPEPAYSPIYRREIDNFHKALSSTYVTQTGKYFPKEDCPALIEIFGSRAERTSMVGLYLNPDGAAYGEETSLLSSL